MSKERRVRVLFISAYFADTVSKYSGRFTLLDLFTQTPPSLAHFPLRIFSSLFKALHSLLPQDISGYHAAQVLN